MAVLQESKEVASLKKRGCVCLHESAAVDLRRFDYVVVSPGVPSNHPLLQRAHAENVEVIGEIELACRSIDRPFVGITGTNGKTTVTLLVGHVLNATGRPAKVLGNVGTPLVTQAAASTGEIIVCELSSYQLESMRSRVIDAGVILNITPDHLDRYPGMEEYASAKARMAFCLKSSGTLYVQEHTLSAYQHLFSGCTPKRYGYSDGCEVRGGEKGIFYQEKLEMIWPHPYRGRRTHDVENIMAAFALCREMGVKGPEFAQALGSFKKPAHRIEFVATKRGVHYYDDSKGTNLDAVVRAVQTMEGPVFLIAGGQPKGQNFSPWALAFAGKVKGVFAIGEAKRQMFEELKGAMPVELCNTLEEAVKMAFAVAKEGENVLLSPGCASFDMFKNYEHRGELFKEIVGSLGGQGS